LMAFLLMPVADHADVLITRSRWSSSRADQAAAA
jgi:hypothetical protein